MIVVTGGAGFIGSCVVSKLNHLGRNDIIVVDALGEDDKWKNLRALDFHDYLDRDTLLPYLRNARQVEAVVHMGACSATTERDSHFLMENNYRYTLDLATHCLEHGIRFIYASSAATYGDGEMGYADDPERLQELKPLNMYGYSKHLFDLKARREGWLKEIVGLKFFNVYGPNEYHKDNMVSVVYRAFHQIKETGSVKLFKSHRPDYENGGQMRDFIYVDDVVRVITALLDEPNVNGIFNLGTGKARTFSDLAEAVFAAMGLPPKIEYIDMPEHLRDRYQYFTQAETARLQSHGGALGKPFISLEDGVADYVKNYLEKDEFY